MKGMAHSGHSARWIVLMFTALIASADAGFQTLRDSALHREAIGRVEGGSTDGDAQGAEVTKALRAAKQVQLVAKQAINHAVRHNRRESSFAESALTADAKSASVDAAGLQTAEPISAGIIVVMTITSMIMKAVTAAEKARLEMLQEKYTEQVQIIIDETSEAVKAMTKNYEAIFGEVSRQLGDLMREMGVATVNLLKEDAVIVSASQKAVSKYGQVTAPSSNDPEATELYDRYRSSPAIVELKDVVENCVLKFKPCNVQTAPPATLSAMRRALAKVVAADYALIHSMGDIRGKGKYSAQLAQYVYAVDPTAMKKLFKLALTSSASLTPILGNEIAAEAALRRMSTAAIGRTYQIAAGKDDAKAMAIQRDANLAILDSKGSIAMQLPETEGRGDAIGEFKETYADPVIDILENGLAFTEFFSGSFSDAVNGGLDIADKVVSGLHAAAAILGVVASAMTMFKLHKAKEETELEFSRDSGVFGERHTHAVRRGMATTCRLFDSLRAPLTGMINTPLTAIAMTDAQVTAVKTTPGNSNFERPDFSSALGLDTLLALTPNAKRRISVTMATRFCGIFQPMLARIEELFTPRGECARELNSTDSSKPQLVGAPDVSASATILPTSAHVLGLAKPPQLTGSALTYPRVETCLKDDIYDIQLAKDATTAASFTKLGYTLMKDIDAGWAPLGDLFNIFEGDINRKVKAPSKPLEPAEAPSGRFTQVYVLTCEALHKAAEKDKCDTKPTKGVAFNQQDRICRYLRTLRFPVTDVTFAYFYPDTLPSEAPQLRMLKAGYRMLYLTENVGSPEDLAHNLWTDYNSTKSAPPKSLDRTALQKFNVRRGIDDKKAVVTMHTMRGGMTPLQDIRLAPFVSVAGKGQFKGDADKLDQPFCVQNSAYSLKLGKGMPLPTRWYPVSQPLPSPISLATTSLTGGVLSMIVPPECKDPVDITTPIDKKWMERNLWQQFRGKEGTEKEVKIIKHTFDSRCPVNSTTKATWERVAASPFPDNDGAVSRTQKPYLWVKRRFALPTIAVSEHNAVAACPWECSEQLKGIVMPPASIYASQSALKTLRDTDPAKGGFDMDRDFELK